MTTNAGANWTDISGNLPNAPVNDIVVDPDMPNTLYVGTDVGVLATTDGGATWAPLGTGLPAVVIMSVKLHHATRILRAASYGRSAWDTQLPKPVGPTAVLSTPTLDFSPQQVGTTSGAQTVTLTNNSSTALSITSVAASSNFAETNTCGTSLAAGANCTISVTFTPATFGPLTGTVTIPDNAAGGSPQTVTLKGNGFSGAVGLSPTNLAFGNQQVGTTSAAQTVTLSNTSSAPLTIVSYGFGNWFPGTTDCPIQPNTLAGGASCHFNISFAPTDVGTVAAQLTLWDSASDSPQSVTETGTGTGPIVSISPYMLTFAPQEVGTTSSPQTATLSNTGNAGLIITNIAISSGPFAETDNCPRSPATVPPGGACTLSVKFVPTNWGQISGTVSVDYGTPSGTQYLPLQGYAYSGTPTFSPASLNFVAALGTTSASQTATLTDTGSSPLYITSMGSGRPGNFIVTNQNCPLSPSALAAGARCTISVGFRPDYSGTLSDTLYVNTSGLPGGASVALSGLSNPDFILAVGNGTSSSATVSPGGTASYILTLTPEAGSTQRVAVACTGAPPHSTCTVTPIAVTLDGTNSQNVQVTVSTTAGSLVSPGPRGTPLAPGSLGLHGWLIALLWLMMGTLGVAFRQRHRSVPLLAGAVLLAAIAVSCGGGGGGGGSGGGGVTNPGTPKGTYTLTVTGASGTLQHSTTLSLTVQ
ncbi:MAG TPA: choice-of-anchor D domain-containing protein, partial [Terriglobia bacterium]|nr:choice-of-anchor D domain-containing protein [Terriglobia bacterium]